MMRSRNWRSMRAAGVANMIYADGDALFVHALDNALRQQATRKAGGIVDDHAFVVALIVDRDGTARDDEQREDDGAEESVHGLPQNL